VFKCGCVDAESSKKARFPYVLVLEDEFLERERVDGDVVHAE
jgi:hypothetical protein